MKKIALIICLFCIGLMQAFAYSYTDKNGVTWGFSVSNSNATITSASGFGEKVTIPGKVYDGGNGYTVTTLRYNLFSNNTTITEVVLPASVVTIERNCFYKCTSLTKVTMPTTPYTIGASAFYGCNGLKSIDLSSCISLSEGSEFNGCSSLETIGSLESCTSIGGYTFKNCSSLESVGDLPVCTVILDEAFANCSSLESVGDLSSLLNISRNVFSGCYSLEKLVLAGDNVVTLGAVLATPTTVFVPQKLLAAYKEANSWKDMTERILPIGVTTERNVSVSAQENTSNLAYGKF